MNLKNQVYIERKRLSDEELVKIKTIIDDEIDRRYQRETNTQDGVSNTRPKA